MANQPWKLPDDFPDLTIHDTEPSASQVNPLLPLAIAALPVPTGAPLPDLAQQWKVGQRVLAPWEPNFLYTGTIIEICGNEARIEFDRGDAGFVQLDQIRELGLERDQKVLCKRNAVPPYFRGKIAEIRGGKARVTFLDGGLDEWTSGAELCIPCESSGPPARPTQSEAERSLLGQRVWAPYHIGFFHIGTIEQVENGHAIVLFDDGRDAWVNLNVLQPLFLKVGMRLISRRRGYQDHYPATISGFEGNLVRVTFEDGKAEWVPPASLALPGEKVLPGVPCVNGTDPFVGQAKQSEDDTSISGSISFGWIISVAVFLICILVRVVLQANR